MTCDWSTKGVTQNGYPYLAGLCSADWRHYLGLTRVGGRFTMRRLVNWYVAAISLIAFAWGFALYRASPASGTSMMPDALLLCALAISAEALRYSLPHSALGSIGFIPYFAAAVVAPGWPSVAAVVFVRVGEEVWVRRPIVKAVLNVASHGVMELVAVSVYTSLGGVGLRTIDHLANLTHVSWVAGFPALVAFAAALIVNNVIVMGAIALSSGRTLGGVARELSRTTMGLDLAAAPLIFVFAWVFAAYGLIAAAACWVPILGLRQVHRVNLELERTNEELLELMVRSLEARDAYTSGHSRRVQQYSTIIARAIGLSERAVQQISRAALLHDVGKIHEKYALVLSKQDKLSSEEWAIIQGHPADGAELVATMTRLRDVVPAIRHHHENWDGTGYPDGLSGEFIPLASRIIRFADTIDAMTTERPYRLPLTEVQVRNEIVRCRGTQFDPMIADRLVASALWSTLFAPATQDRGPARLSIVGHRERGAGTVVARGA